MSLAWVWIPILLVALGVGGYFLYPRLTFKFGSAGGPGGGKGMRDFAGRAMPVGAAAAHQGDVNIYLSGLGTVTPLNTVVVRSRVDGELMKVDFVEGQTVKAGQLLFEIDTRSFQVQLEQAEGQMAKDTAQLNNAKADLQRYQIAKEAVSQQQLDTAAANVAQYEGAVKIDQSAIDSARLSLTYCKIAAPLTGRIGLKVVDQGNIIHASDPSGLAVITQEKPIAVLFSLAEDKIPEVVKRMNSGEKLAVDAFDRSFRNKIATGTLLAIDSQIDQTSASVRFKAVFPNEDGALFPNQFVNARLLINTIHNAVLVPSAAIQRSPTSTFVYVIKGDKESGTVDMRDVEVGPAEGEFSSIVSGLEAGERVVTDGVDKLQPGSKVSLGGGRGGATRPSGAATRGGGGEGGGERGSPNGRNGAGRGAGAGVGEGNGGAGAGGDHPRRSGGGTGNGQRQGSQNRGATTRPAGADQ